MGNRYKYDAFISYRHSQPDSEIAQLLQKKLENFRLPKAIEEKIGKKRPLRVFRDETELSGADDLSEAISNAIWESKYLICICSPQYLESVWCMKEIEAFLRFNDRKHILMVLADGEPDTAFPEVLLYEEIFQMGPDGHPQKIRQYKEPLAADCRGDSSKERKAKADNAVVRLVAGIRGISYEDLAQRHRKEAYNRIRNRVLAGFCALLAIIGVCVFFLVRISKQKSQITRQQDELRSQKEEIEAQKDTIQQKYADSMAGISGNLLRNGKRKDAVYAARSVLPDDPSEGFSEASLMALSEALGVYTFSDQVTSDDTFQLPAAISEFDISPSGGYASVLCLDWNRYVMDLSTGKTLLRYEDVNYADAGFDGERGFVFQRENENYTYLDFSSGKETDLGIGDAKIMSDPMGYGYSAVTDNAVVILRGTDVLCRLDLQGEMPAGTNYVRTNAYVFFSKEGEKAWIFVIDYDTQTTNAYSADLLQGNVKLQFTDTSGIIDIRSDGKTMLSLKTGGLEKWYLSSRDLDTGKEVDLELGSSVIGFAVFGEDVVLCKQTEFSIYDRNLELKISVVVEEGISTCMTTPDGIVIFDLDDGCYIVRDWDYRSFDPDVEESSLIWSRKYVDGTLYISGTGDHQINTFNFRESDHLFPYDGNPVKLELTGLLDDPEIAEIKKRVMEKETEYGPDMIYGVVLCDNADYAAFQLWDGVVYVYSRSSGEHVKTISSIDEFVRTFYYDERSENYYISSESCVVVLDKEFRSISNIPGCCLYGSDPATGHLVVVRRRGDDNVYYLLKPVSYEELIRSADELLSGYEPNERIKEKYGLS